MARNWRALEFASPRLRGDPTVVAGALEQHYRALRHALPSLQGDRAPLRRAFGADARAGADRDFVRRALQRVLDDSTPDAAAAAVKRSSSR